MGERDKGFISRIKSLLDRNQGEPRRLITREVAEEELQRSLGVFTSPGILQKDVAAQLMIQSLIVLRGRTNKPDLLQYLYGDSNSATEKLPGIATTIVRGLREGSMTSDQARETIDQAVAEYREIFQGMGLSLRMPRVLVVPTQRS